MVVKVKEIIALLVTTSSLLAAADDDQTPPPHLSSSVRSIIPVDDSTTVTTTAHDTTTQDSVKDIGVADSDESSEEEHAEYPTPIPTFDRDMQLILLQSLTHKIDELGRDLHALKSNAIIVRDLFGRTSSHYRNFMSINFDICFQELTNTGHSPIFAHSIPAIYGVCCYILDDLKSFIEKYTELENSYAQKHELSYEIRSSINVATANLTRSVYEFWEKHNKYILDLIWISATPETNYHHVYAFCQTARQRLWELHMRWKGKIATSSMTVDNSLPVPVFYPEYTPPPYLAISLDIQEELPSTPRRRGILDRLSPRRTPTPPRTQSPRLKRTTSDSQIKKQTIVPSLNLSSAKANGTPSSDRSHYKTSPKDRVKESPKGQKSQSPRSLFSFWRRK